MRPGLEEKKVNEIGREEGQNEMIRSIVEGRDFRRTDCVNCTEDSGRSEKIV